MGRIRYALIGLLLALPLLGWVAIAHAQSFRSGGNVTVPSGQTVNSTLFVAGSTIDIAGNVNGDLFCAGSNVHVSGRVRGDVICAGQNLTITGAVSGDVRLAGQNVTLGSKVEGNATIASQSFVQQSGSIVARDISLGVQDATLNGAVGRDVAASGKTLIIAGPVGRNVQASVDQLKLGNGAKVAGNISYTSSNKLSRSSGAQVAGTVTQHAPAEGQKHMFSVWALWPLLLYMYITCLVAALVLVLLFPRVFEHAAGAARASMGKTLLAGLAAGIIMPILILGLMVTVVGIPLALLLGLAWLLVVLLAGPFAAYLLGRLLLRGQTNAVLVMLLGAALLFLLYALPIAGFLFWLVGTWFGLGAILLQLHHVGRPHYTVGSPPPAEPQKVAVM